MTDKQLQRLKNRHKELTHNYHNWRDISIRGVMLILTTILEVLIENEEDKRRQELLDD